ncbi:nucleoid-associated protein [Sporomusa sphaeroides DSM 2875]|uniref:nucleoid-associated protein n=1 Tax=Sporomusa sphaeroides TaxID=47679 RepID=UPI0020303203|nr:nucleoid-associated protein [Sporomusa sphaeroides]MCM0758613.1 nucleoid-associated protein [Sporomusa sphaeroides DSM 2875]
MLIHIDKAILHILDFNSGVTVFSEQELDITSNSVVAFLTKHIEKLYQDQSAKTGTFYPNSKFRQQVADYLAGGVDFTGFSIYAAELMYAAMAQADALASTDVLICDFTIDSNRMLALLKCNNKIGFIHQVVQENDKIKNDIINHYAILPGLAQKLDEYAFIDANSLAITFVDKKRSVNGVETYILADQVLECSSRVSPKETLALVNAITRTVAENHGASTVEAVAKAKNYIVENTGISEQLDPVALGKEVFSASPAMQAEYIKEVESAGIAETVKIDKDFAVKKGKSHKIKTDTGIEITFPVDYFESSEYIEFVNNPDGTISIQLKNIGSIINK